MTNDGDWVEDVRRWYFNGGRIATASSAKMPTTICDDATEVGYEAANPTVQTSSWSKPVPSAFGSLS